jgi:diguanylate cyclase (GGDEF)-like protein
MVGSKKEKWNDSIEMKSFEKLNPRQAALRISAVYMLVGALWILLSDKVLSFLVNDIGALTRISMLKGWAYVIITGLLIYALVRTAFIRIMIAEEKLYVSYQSLRAASTEMEHQAHHDQITGVQNRLALIKRINKLINSGGIRKTALIILDIDNFKYINDTMGHSFGDQLLVMVSARLGSLADGLTTIFRLSGDEFVILLEDFEESIEVERLAAKLLKGFNSRFDINNSNMFISISMGISLYPEHGDSMDELFKNADIALYKAKETGRNRIVFYAKSMNEAVSERVLIEKHLRTALDNNEFELHYQPQIDIVTNKVSGFEALIRWKSPELGSVPPLKFISIAEDTHMIIPIGEWVLRSACMYIKGLHQKGYEGLCMSVNISMLQLLQDDFVDKVIEVLDWSKLDPKYLELEITESILMESYEAIAGKLKQLKDRGIKLALDDFGKGYSSLNYLRQLPISTLKIDKSFIDTIGSAGKHKSLTDLMVKIGRTMGMCVVAEGVETQVQLDYLVKHKCDKIQGYLFSKPITGEAVLDTLIEQGWNL